MGAKESKSLLDVSMELKMTGRGLERQSMKLENGEKNEMKKIKDVSEVGLGEAATTILPPSVPIALVNI